MAEGRSTECSTKRQSQTTRPAARKEGPPMSLDPETIIPAFRDATEEGNLVGRLLAGYSELEVEMLGCAIEVTHDTDASVRALYGTRGEFNRIKTMRKLTEAAFVKAGFGRTYAATMDDMDWCRTIRNEYAHCQWYYTPQEGLCFVHLEDLARGSAKIDSLMNAKLPVDAKLLSQQEAFFKYVQKCFWYLGEQYRRRTTTTVLRNAPLFQLPSTMARPRPHY
jgi:hypothetical protein